MRARGVRDVDARVEHVVASRSDDGDGARERANAVIAFRVTCDDDGPAVAFECNLASARRLNDALEGAAARVEALANAGVVGRGGSGA